MSKGQGCALQEVGAQQMLVHADPASRGEEWGRGGAQSLAGVKWNSSSMEVTGMRTPESREINTELLSFRVRTPLIFATLWLSKLEWWISCLSRKLARFGWLLSVWRLPSCKRCDFRLLAPFGALVLASVKWAWSCLPRGAVGGLKAFGCEPRVYCLHTGSCGYLG